MGLEQDMKIKSPKGFTVGHNEIITQKENPEMLMDFGILKLNKDKVFVSDEGKERALLFLYGKVELEWEGQKATIERGNIFDDGPWTLHVPKGVKVKITGIAEDSEFTVHKTDNPIRFASKLYTPEECVVEFRGKGQMNEAGTRMVRTILDKSISPDANLMLGEDVHYPGKWAGFPSHSHEQPEIYFYRFNPDNGFGLLRLGDEGVCLEENDTVKIPPNLVHPQVAAPGYAMYFLWVIRHLEGNPYIKPNFEEQHLWVEKPDAKFWPDK